MAAPLMVGALYAVFVNKFEANIILILGHTFRNKGDVTVNIHQAVYTAPEAQGDKQICRLVYYLFIFLIFFAKLYT